MKLQPITHQLKCPNDLPLEAAIYIAGPMTGHPELNYPNFFLLENKLKDLGFKNVLNPASNPKDPSKHSWETFMRDAIRMVIDSDVIVFLDGWETSMGANIEIIIGRALKLKIYDQNLNPLLDGSYRNETICQEADRLVSIDRGNDYGHPLEDFGRTGSLWAPILSNWAKLSNGDDPIPAELVGLCMIALKISREINRPKRDNRVDIAGYAKCLEMINEKRASMSESSMNL